LLIFVFIISGVAPNFNYKGAIKMNGIVKRRKKVDFAQIHNTPLQTLEDIRSIGLIAHLMSLPETWEIKKMQLYNKFGRGPITSAINELESKKYWVDIKYRDGKKNYHYYNASDVPFEDNEVIGFMKEVTESGYKVLEISEPFSHLFSIVENQQLNKPRQINDSSIVDFQQLNFNCSFSTVENQHLLNKDINKQIDINKINNKEILVNNTGLQDLNEIISKVSIEFMNQGLTKNLCLRVANECLIKEDIKDFESYFRGCLENTLHKVQLKNGTYENINIPFFDWLNN
jgi:hypothetical protein